MSIARLTALGIALFVPIAACAQENEAATAPLSQHLNWTFDPIHSMLTATAASPVTSVANAGRANTVSETTTIYTGRVNITLTIELVSPLPKGAAIRCGGNAALQYQTEQKTGTFILIEFATQQTTSNVDATISGNTAKCMLSIPYQWSILPAGAGETVTVQGVTAAVGIASAILAPDGSVVRTLRSSSMEVGSSPKPPPDGSITAFKASTVL